MCARHCFLPSMTSWMLMSASQPAQFACDVPVQLLSPAVAVGAGPFSAGQCRAEAPDVVTENLLGALALRRRLLQQAEGGVEDRDQVAAGEVPVGQEVDLDLLPC